MSRAHATTDHQRIRQWVEQRGGHPSAVTATGDHGLLRVDFEPHDAALEQIDWDIFFDTFDRKELAFLYQDKTGEGKLSRFNKFIDRNSVEVEDLEQAPDTESPTMNANSGVKASKSSTGKPQGKGKAEENKSGKARSAAAADSDDEDDEWQDVDADLDEDAE